MSWQAYVDNNLVGTHKVAKGAIYGHDGSLWASSPNFNVGGAEVQKLIAAFNDESDIAANGLFLEGNKFVFLRKPEPHVIYARHGATGVACVKTTQAVLVGYYDENIQAGDCNTVVDNLANYLISTGY
ncbi:putative profilin [Gamsiella multidivaricata]|uniref:putative profilin n=1 Tax=Gamsiella multidivaricata TaxID=101098 RepID=UPI00221E7ECD|nr:putative profilin [Gamsiella multidivaricata]KAI7831263.1 putative profilin [Gamsiella multidivaricata]